MKLKALDQVHISSVKADSLRPGEEFVVSDAMGEGLLKQHPDKFSQVSKDQPQERASPAPIGAKAETAPQNKAEPAPANKTDNPPRRKRGK